MEKHAEFDEIRPYYDEELPQVYEELIADPQFQHIATIAMPDIPFDKLTENMRLCKTKLAFQRAFCYKFLWNVAKASCDGLTLDYKAIKDKKLAYAYISNHRDITLDSGFLSILLMDQDMDTVEIAIGDNLLIYPWIKKFVRVNKSFIVQRGLSMRQQLESSRRLSRYIHYTIADKNQSVWIAQREGRAKDASDRTQESLLKMFAMEGDGSTVERLLDLNIAPLTISYEYDPCDFLKAMEFQLKRDNPDYKKAVNDDLMNMATGITGYKGRVHFKVASCINEKLLELDKNLPKQELFTYVATLIDKRIHSNYVIYAGNYVAYDMLLGNNEFSDKYSEQEKQHFEEYLQKQLDKITIPGKDIPFLREKLLQMYANPLINYLEATE